VLPTRLIEIGIGINASRVSILLFLVPYHFICQYNMERYPITSSNIPAVKHSDMPHVSVDYARVIHQQYNEVLFEAFGYRIQPGFNLN